MSYTATTVPKYFAGWHEIEDVVNGGTGDTIEDAVRDFISQYASDECDFYGANDPCIVEVQVFECISRQNAENMGIAPAEWDEDWQWMTGKRVKTFRYKGFQVPNKKFPDLPDWAFEYVEVLTNNELRSARNAIT